MVHLVARFIWDQRRQAHVLSGTRPYRVTGFARRTDTACGDAVLFRKADDSGRHASPGLKFTYRRSTVLSSPVHPPVDPETAMHVKLSRGWMIGRTILPQANEGCQVRQSKCHGNDPELTDDA